MTARGLVRSASLMGVAAASLHAMPVIGWCPPARPLFPSLHRIENLAGIALTFDDGPGPGLPAFLEVLGESGARATFFVTGEQALRSPTLVRDALAAGHEIGIHSDRHRCHLRLPPWEAVDDLRRAGSTIEGITGRQSTLFRPPYGLFSLASWREMERQGWQPVLWSRWGRDWTRRATPASIVAALGPFAAGDILLLHDDDRYGATGSWRRTLAALPDVLDRCRLLNLSPLTVSEMSQQSARIAID